MKIICPKCNKENNIAVPDGTSCRHCAKPLDKYKFRRTLIPAFLLVAMGAGGTQAYKHITEHPRYPVKIEYALIDKCISSYDAPLSRTSFKKKRDACINAVEEIQNEVPFSEFERDQKVFMEVFAIYAKILEQE